MKKARVYWSYGKETLQFIDIVGFPPERLISYMKKDPIWRDNYNYAKILECPATIEQLKNTYVMLSPVDITLQCSSTGSIKTLPHGTKTGPNEYAQLIGVANWYFFSEESVMLSMTPPFMHPENAVGVCATFDISKWFRPVLPAFMLEKNQKLQIKRGRPLMYVSFDRPVELVQFELTDKLGFMAQNSAEIKHKIPRLSLKYLYSLFEKNNLKHKVLRDIKQNLLRRDKL